VTQAQRVLLINPSMIAKRHARFPLAVMNLSAALECRHSPSILDGNTDRGFVSTALDAIAGGLVDAVGVTVMGGPQLTSAIAVSKAIRERHPTLPIIWGGSFASICPDAALNVPYVDYAIRGQGEETLAELLDEMSAPARQGLGSIAGLSWRHGGQVLHNKDRVLSGATLRRRLPYDKLENPRQYLTRSYLGERTAGYQAALGCRFRCTFCGVAAMFRGKWRCPLRRVSRRILISQELPLRMRSILRSQFFRSRSGHGTTQVIAI
jgi:radical SAM superfamily enzyme YgiQ (UPF0313 family)